MVKRFSSFGGAMMCEWTAREFGFFFSCFRVGEGDVGNLLFRCFLAVVNASVSVGCSKGHGPALSHADSLKPYACKHQEMMSDGLRLSTILFCLRTIALQDPAKCMSKYESDDICKPPIAQSHNIKHPQ